MFLLPMYVAASYVCRRNPSPTQRQGMIEYFFNVQNEDGGIGLHAEARIGTMFTSVLVYVALRLLNVQPGDARLDRLRAWILDRGGAVGAASWGKWILAVLNLYDYRGLWPILPELFWLPAALPFHPARCWCHARQVYLPAAYLHANQAQIPEDDLIRQLRNEIYVQPYGTIRFEMHRDTLAETDRLTPASNLAPLLNRLARLYESGHLSWIRKRALTKIRDHIRYEDQVTNFVRLGPVNAVLNTFVEHFRGESVERSWQGVSQYLWDGHDGLKMNGYISSALWDTAFTAQMVLESPAVFAHRRVGLLERAFDYICKNQIQADVPNRRRYYRDICRGGWGFGDAVNGWPVTDCTAEALQAILGMEAALGVSFPKERLQDAVRFILDRQNSDGGWSTYERRRGGRWLERLNPSQVFRDIMVDYSYVECTAACLKALVKVGPRLPGKFDREIRRATARGRRFIERKQREDGSWQGSWGICFTYGTWFGVAGLLAAGIGQHASSIQRAADFLRRWQNQDGGWGEDYESCLQRRYIGRASLAVNTAWALMALVAAGHADSNAVRRAARFLLDRQQDDGDWPREAMTGVFNKTVAINYENYRRYFSTWALSAYYAAACKVP